MSESTAELHFQGWTIEAAASIKATAAME